MRTVVFNQKGGVGKSTITCNLAAVSAEAGRRTLVVDLDPRGNSTSYLLGPRDLEPDQTLAGFFNQSLSFTVHPRPIGDFAMATPFAGLEVLASHRLLEEQRDKLERRYKMYKLRDALQALEGYDAVFLDTPPALDFYARSALIAAQRCLIPFDCDSFSRQALYDLLAGIQEIQQDHNRELRLEGVVVNQFQPRARLPGQLVEGLVRDGLPVLPTYLGASVKVRESHERARPLVFLAPGHKLAMQYRELYAHLDPAVGRGDKASAPRSRSTHKKKAQERYDEARGV